MTQSMTEPPCWHPKQCHRFFAGVTTKLGSASACVPNGQRLTRSAPFRFSTTPRASTKRSKEISRFNRSISDSGMRAIRFADYLKKLSSEKVVDFRKDY